MLSMVDGLHAELDLVTLKAEDLSHLQRIGDARMFRVPVGSASRAERRELYQRAVARQLGAEPYQVVHVMDPWAGAIALEQREALGYSLVYDVGSFPDPDGDEESLWLEAHERTLAGADRILVATLTAAQTLERRGLKGRVEVVRPGVDVGGLDWADVPRFGTPRLLYLGPFSTVRDLSSLLGAVERVSKLRPVRVLLAGEGDRARRADVREQVKRAGLSEIVDVRGEPQPRNVARIIAAADVCLAPAVDYQVAGLSELPQPLLEYMACFRPVVAAAVPGIHEILGDEQEGLLYPAGDAGAMADAILETLRDAALRERITEAGYRRVREELNSGARRRRIREIYEGLVPGSQVRDPWIENFDEITAVTELSTELTEAPPGEEGAETLIPPPGDAASDLQGSVEGSASEEEAPDPDDGPLAASVGGNPRPGSWPRSPDTQPSLVVPDTDPGLR